MAMPVACLTWMPTEGGSMNICNLDMHSYDLRMYSQGFFFDPNKKKRESTLETNANANAN